MEMAYVITAPNHCFLPNVVTALREPAPALSTKRLTSVEQLRAYTSPWDDLWQRSDVRNPRARAQVLALAARYFAQDGAFSALTVRRGERLVAAMPMVRQPRMAGVLNTGGQLQGESVSCPGLVADGDESLGEVMDCLMAGVKQLPWSVLCFSQVAYETRAWRAFRAAAARAGLPLDIRTDYWVGQVDMDGDWDVYFASRTRSHRHACRQHARQLEKAGGVDLRIWTGGEAAELDELLERGWGVEDRSWKGEAGTSVLRVPGMPEYYRREAQLLAEAGQLALAFLEHQGQPIAFSYGWNCKDTYLTPKVGYDAAYARFGPGQQLIMRLLEHGHQDPRCHLLDFAGPLADWTSKWTTRRYPVGRVLLSTGHPWARSIMRMYCGAHKKLRSMKSIWQMVRGDRAQQASTDDAQYPKDMAE